MAPDKRSTESKGIKKYRVPDWRNPDEYSYINDLNDDQLRWEFLRRDETYRSLANEDSRPKVHFLLGKFIDPKIRGDELPNDFMFLDNIRRGNGLGLVPPSIQSLFFKKFQADPSRPGGEIDGYMGAQLRELAEAGYVLIAFNPFKAWKAQFDAAKTQFKKARDYLAEQDPSLLKEPGAKSKNTIRDRIKLLRVIDAHHDGLKPLEIGLTFYNQKREASAEASASGATNLHRALNYWKTL